VRDYERRRRPDQPAVQPLGEVVDPRQRRGVGGNSTGDEEGLDQKARLLEGCSVVTFMPPSIAPNSDGRCGVSRQTGETVSLLPAHSRWTGAGLAGLRTEHATVTKRDATFHPGTTLLRP
jgi:hypothetical protein